MASPAAIAVDFGWDTPAAMAKATAPPARKSRPLLSMLEPKRFCLSFFIGSTSLPGPLNHSADGVVVRLWLSRSGLESSRRVTNEVERTKDAVIAVIFCHGSFTSAYAEAWQTATRSSRRLVNPR